MVTIRPTYFATSSYPISVPLAATVVVTEATVTGRFVVDAVVPFVLSVASAKTRPGFVSAGFVVADVASAGFASAGFVSVAFASAGFASATLVPDGCVSAGFASAGFASAGFASALCA